MNQTIQTNQSAATEANIIQLTAKITEMKSVLPYVKSLQTRRRLGEQVKQFQSDIYTMRKEMCSNRF